MIVGLLVGIVVLAIIILTLGYLGFFQTEKIKRCLEPHKYEIPPVRPTLLHTLTTQTLVGAVSTQSVSASKRADFESVRFTISV